MELKEGNFYHLYYQGNNKKKIFFTHENYNFFLRKIENQIIPYCEILAWCLMPNHFHILLFVKNESIIENEKNITLNSSIGLMLRSYTRAINNQNNWTGSLFRQKSKAKNIEVEEFKFADRKTKSYLNECFNYILLNPVKDELVTKPHLWEFSSYSDTIGIRKPRLINLKLIKQLELTLDYPL